MKTEIFQGDKNMKEVVGKLIDKILDIQLSGHIDSNNAPEVESEVMSIMDHTSGFQDIVIDAKKLAYISSAGLRVLLRIRKMHTHLRIINVSAEVYDILDMTGFTQMLDVEKAYREVSIDGAEIIGQGANGTLYRIDEDNVVKVYNNPDALDEIQNEREMAKTALILGIPTAISYDVVKVNGSYGSVFELLNASSFATILNDHPEKFDWCVAEFTEMLNRIHSTVVPEGKLPDIKKTVYQWVDFMKDYLPAEAVEKLTALVNGVPHDNHMIHGDYHIKNLELQGDEVLLIDMDTLATGNPIFELSSMYNAFVGYAEIDHSNVEKFLGIPYELCVRFWRAVLARYLGTDNEAALDEVEKKARVIGYVRMMRRSIRRDGLKDELKRKEIEHWKEELLQLLEEVDSLLFLRNVIRIEATVAKLPEVLSFVGQHLEKAGCGAGNQMKIETAVEEIFVNIASYAYGDASGECTLNMEITENPRAMILTFRDSGVPFDPLAKEDPDVTLSAEERQIGGLGIYMVRKTMDEVIYEYKDGQNVLTMKKFF